MPVDVSFIDPQIVFVNYHGFITYEELRQAYTTILDHHHHQHTLRYFIGAGIEMMYQSYELFDEELAQMAEKILFSDTFRAAIFISLSNHPLAKTTSQTYAKRGISDKLHFVKDYETALALIAEVEEAS